MQQNLVYVNSWKDILKRSGKPLRNISTSFANSFFFLKKHVTTKAKRFTNSWHMIDAIFSMEAHPPEYRI